MVSQTVPILQSCGHPEHPKWHGIPVCPTIENFYKFCGEQKLVGLRCLGCKRILVPPRGICPSCHSDKFEWIQMEGKGKLATFTVIFFPPTQFQALAPYAVGIVKLKEGAQLPGIIKNLKLEDLEIGMDLVVDFETAIPREWPQWPRYFFRQP